MAARSVIGSRPIGVRLSTGRCPLMPLLVFLSIWPQKTIEELDDANRPRFPELGTLFGHLSEACSYMAFLHFGV